MLIVSNCCHLLLICYNCSMNILPHQQRAIDIMIRHENEMNELYTAYAKKFPEARAFWEEIAMEEEAHAATVEQIGRSIEGGLAFFEKDRFKTPAIALSLVYINDKIKEAKNKEITLFHALTVALDIERSLIENAYFQLADEDSESLRHILTSLQLGAEAHLKKVQIAWDIEKAK